MKLYHELTTEELVAYWRERCEAEERNTSRTFFDLRDAKAKAIDIKAENERLQKQIDSMASHILEISKENEKLKH